MRYDANKKRVVFLFCKKLGLNCVTEMTSDARPELKSKLRIKEIFIC